MTTVNGSLVHLVKIGLTRLFPNVHALSDEFQGKVVYVWLEHVKFLLVLNLQKVLFPTWVFIVFYVFKFVELVY